MHDCSGVEWFFEEAVSAALDCFERGALVVRSGNYDYLRRRHSVARGFDDCQSFADVFELRRQVQIADYHVDAFLLQKLHCFRARGRFEHPIVRV